MGTVSPGDVKGEAINETQIGITNNVTMAIRNMNANWNKWFAGELFI